MGAHTGFWPMYPAPESGRVAAGRIRESQFVMATKDIVVIGASAGGIDALKILVATLPEDLKAAIFITLHVAPYSDGILPEILERAGALPASNAKDWEPIQHGRIYVAPPDYHLLFEKDGLFEPRADRVKTAFDPPSTRCSEPLPIVLVRGLLG